MIGLKFLERVMLMLLGAFGAVSGLRLTDAPNLDDVMILILALMGIALVAYIVALRIVRPYRVNATEVQDVRR